MYYMLILVLPEKREKEKRKNLLCTNICKDVIDVDSFNTHQKEIYIFDVVSFLLWCCLLKLILTNPLGKPGPHIEPRLSVHAFPSRSFFDYFISILQTTCNVTKKQKQIKPNQMSYLFESSKPQGFVEKIWRRNNTLVESKSKRS